MDAKFDLAEIKRNGYPCSSAEFWWLVDEVMRLRDGDARLSAWDAKCDDPDCDPCRYCDGTGQYPPPGAGMGVLPGPCPNGCDIGGA